MSERIARISKPRCILVYAHAPAGLAASDANRLFNEFIDDPALPLPVFHDHFIGQPGGIAVFFVESPEQRDALLQSTRLQGWAVDYRPLIYSYSPAAFDDQIAFTLRAYRGLDWEELRVDQRPSNRDPSRESETAEEAND